MRGRVRRGGRAVRFPKAVAVELDGEIVQREDYPTARLHSGAVVEIVRMVGGGSRV